MSKKPLILITNDDGITAPGIQALVEVMREIGEVIVVAPDAPQSGKGHAITLNAPVRLKKVKVFKDLDAYECSGTPVDCVKLAKHVVLKGRKIDICVSGVNHGSNASINILYSGTMSAAMEASIEGIPSIGFSLLDFSFEHANFEPSKKYIRELALFVLKNGLPNGMLLNVNIPKLPAESIKGMKICRQAKGYWKEEFLEAYDPYKQPYYWLTGKFILDDHQSDTDIQALEEGYVSVVPSMHDLTDYKALNFLSEKL
jgi:5'-nucleotidase